MTREELNAVLERHGHWLREDCEGWQDMKAYLNGADLNGADLRGAYLRGADLNGAYLNGADLNGADLRWADLRGAYLRGADLRGADLRWADLSRADLSRADLNEKTQGVHMATACPTHGAFVAWKAAGGFIVKLLIPEDARRSSATTSKCRGDKAVVVAIETADGQDACVREVSSNYDNSFIYKIGETVHVDNYDENRWNECSTGIHFFVDREEAVTWLNY